MNSSSDEISSSCVLSISVTLDPGTLSPVVDAELAREDRIALGAGTLSPEESAAGIGTTLCAGSHCLLTVPERAATPVVRPSPTHCWSEG